MTSSWLPEECGSVTRETVLDGVPRVSSGFQTRCESAPGVTSLEVRSAPIETLPQRRIHQLRRRDKELPPLVQQTEFGAD